MTRGYRVHSSRLASGSILRPGNWPPAKTANSDLDRKRQEVEQLFDCMKPEGKQSRLGARFVFECERDARSHIANRHIAFMYEIDLSVHEVSHRGDWRWLELAMAEPELAKDYAARYWDGMATDEPVWEYIVTGGVVGDEIMTPDDLRELRAERDGMPRPDDFKKISFDSSE